jgi:hypothetical protein
LVIFHHDPLHNDDFLDNVGQAVKAEFPDSLMAREGMIIHLGGSEPVVVLDKLDD